MLKTNKVLEWFVVDKDGNTEVFVNTREVARESKNIYNNVYPLRSPFRIVKSVVTK